MFSLPYIHPCIVNELKLIEDVAHQSGLQHVTALSELIWARNVAVSVSGVLANLVMNKMVKVVVSQQSRMMHLTKEILQITGA